MTGEAEPLDKNAGSDKANGKMATANRKASFFGDFIKHPFSAFLIIFSRAL
jgi:hypothetical protein